MINFLSAHSFIFAQIFGFSAMAVAILMYQSNRHKTLMLLMVLCSGLWCCHFLFLGKYAAVAANVLNVIRSAVYSFRDKKWAQSKFIPIAFMVAFFISAVCTWENIWCIFPLIGCMFSTVANWQTNTKKLRILSLPICITWFTYNAVNSSYAGMANEIFSFSSVVVAIIRYDILKKPEKIIAK